MRIVVQLFADESDYAAMSDEYRVLTFFPEREAHGLESILQEAADEGFDWVDMVSRDRLVYIIMKREKKVRSQAPTMAESLARSKQAVPPSVAPAKPAVANSFVHAEG